MDLLSYYCHSLAVTLFLEGVKGDCCCSNSTTVERKSGGWKAAESEKSFSVTNESERKEQKTRKRENSMHSLVQTPQI